MSNPKWSWKVETQPSESDRALIESLPSWMIAQSSVEGTSDLDTEEEVREGLRKHIGEDFKKILWVVPFGEEPEDDWPENEEE